MRKRNSTLIFFNVLLIYGVFHTMEMLYLNEVSAYYGMFKTDNQNVDNSKLTSVVLVYVVPAVFLLVRSKNNLIYSIKFCFIVLGYYPNIILLKYDPLHQGLIVIAMILFLLFLWITPTIRKAKLSTIRIKEKHKNNLLVISALTLIVPFVFIFSSNLNPNNFFLEDIYEVRRSSKVLGNSYTNYVYRWLTKFILPILFINSLTRKDFKVAILSIVIFLFLFLTNAMKSTLFSILVLVSFYYGSYIQKCTLFAIGIILLGTYSYFTSGLDFGSVHFFRRVLFIPAYLNQCYFDFFSNNELTFLSQSKFNPFMTYVYDLEVPNLIGKYYFGNERTHANNGFPSDPYFNFGRMGIIVYAIIYAAIFKYFNNLRLDPKYFGVFFLLLMSMRAATLNSILFTSGLFLLLLFARTFMFMDTQTLKTGKL